MKKLILLCVSIVFTICGECKQIDVSDANKLVDSILEKARQQLPDPMRLPPRSTFVELSDGVLWGMSNITRLGDSIVTVEDDIITIKNKITTDEMKGRYTWTKERKNSNWEGYVLFLSSDFEADIEMKMTEEQEENHPRLGRFEIKKFKSAKIEITGLGYFTWALSEMTTLMSGIFQRAIASAVQGPLEEAIEREMREISLIE